MKDLTVKEMYEDIIGTNLNDVFDLPYADKDRAALMHEVVEIGKLKIEEEKIEVERKKMELEHEKMDSSKKLMPNDILRSVTEIGKSLIQGGVALGGVALILAAENVDFKTLATKAWTFVAKPKI